MSRLFQRELGLHRSQAVSSCMRDLHKEEEEEEEEVGESKRYGHLNSYKVLTRGHPIGSADDTNIVIMRTGHNFILIANVQRSDCSALV